MFSIEVRTALKMLPCSWFNHDVYRLLSRKLINYVQPLARVCDTFPEVQR